MADLKRYRATSGERNLIERIKAPIFLEVVLEEKVNARILKDAFSSRIDPSIEQLEHP